MFEALAGGVHAEVSTFRELLVDLPTHHLENAIGHCGAVVERLPKVDAWDGVNDARAHRCGCDDGGDLKDRGGKAQAPAIAAEPNDRDLPVGIRAPEFHEARRQEIGRIRVLPLGEEFGADRNSDGPPVIPHQFRQW